MTSVALKAKIRKNCKDTRREMKTRWRLLGSWAVWFWLARIIRGRSQQVSTKRGVERGSVAINKLRVDQPVSAGFFNQVRLTSAIIRL